MKSIRVNIQDIEKTKEYLIKNNFFNRDYKILVDKKYAYLPIKNIIEGYKIFNKELGISDKKDSFYDLLSKKLNKEELALIPKSFDTVGSIAILELDKNLKKYYKFIASCLIKFNKNIKTVVAKDGGHRGRYRIQNYKHLAGVNTYATVHKENGITAYLDISKVYFSQRLSNERLRIANQVKDNEKILIMFSGIGIFSLVTKKINKTSLIYNIEWNKEACKFSHKNSELNGFKDITDCCGDVRKIIPKLNIKFDRILMPAPHDATEYLDLIFEVAKKGTIVHIYDFSKEDEIPKKTLEKINEVFKKFNKKYELLSWHKCGQNKPREYRICLDIKLKN